jgi:hypothetical protein
VLTGTICSFDGLFLFSREKADLDEPCSWLFSADKMKQQEGDLLPAKVKVWFKCESSSTGKRRRLASSTY